MTTLVPDLLPPKEAAEYLGGLAPQTLAVWRCNGRYDLPYIKYGKTIRYRRADLDEFMRRRTVGSVD